MQLYGTLQLKMKRENYLKNWSCVFTQTMKMFKPFEPYDTVYTQVCERWNMSTKPLLNNQLYYISINVCYARPSWIFPQFFTVFSKQHFYSCCIFEHPCQFFPISIHLSYMWGKCDTYLCMLIVVDWVCWTQMNLWPCALLAELKQTLAV